MVTEAEQREQGERKVLRQNKSDVFLQTNEVDDGEFLAMLERGELRAAEYDAEQDAWQPSIEVKRRILGVFRHSQNVEMGEMAPLYAGFVDRGALPPRRFTLVEQIRLVPGGSAVRTGAYIGPRCTVMPPSYVNIGAYVDEETVVDSHVLVGSCAQIGRRVHLGAAVQIGGVLEPVGSCPVVVEDEAFIGAGAVILEGVVVKQGAVIAPGVVLSGATPIYDLVQQQIHTKVVPAGAVVVPGVRRINREDAAVANWVEQHGLGLQCPIVVKYRDAQTAAAIELEEVFRGGNGGGK